jgi:hypothetical protein
VSIGVYLWLKFLKPWSLPVLILLDDYHRRRYGVDLAEQVVILLPPVGPVDIDFSHFSRKLLFPKRGSGDKICRNPRLGNMAGVAVSAINHCVSWSFSP